MPRFMGFVRMEEGVGTPPQALGWILDLYDDVDEKVKVPRSTVRTALLISPAIALSNQALAFARKAAMTRLTAPRNGVPLNAQRMFLGKDPSKSAVLNLSDPNGKPRLRLVVDSLGAARIEFLDAAGKVTNTVTGK